MDNVIIAFIVFFSCSFFLLLLVFLSLKKLSGIKRRAVHTTGTIIGFDPATNKLSIRYMVNGAELISKCVILFASSVSTTVVVGIAKKTEYYLGEEILITYDANKPKNILVDGGEAFYIMFSIAMSIAALFGMTLPFLLSLIEKTH